MVVKKIKSGGEEDEQWWRKDKSGGEEDEQWWRRR